MSRGFVKEEDQEMIPIVPPRADLPKGISNYVTKEGLQALRQEEDKLRTEIETLDTTHEKEHRIMVNHINAKLQLLQERIATAKVIDLSQQPQDEVRFGATVTVQADDQNLPQKYQLVGVDEANITQGKISFISPMAKILINKKVGDKAILKLAKQDRIFEIKAIQYH